MADLTTMLRTYVDACNARAFARLDAFVHDHLELNGRRISREEFVVTLKDIVEAVPDYLWRIEDCVSDGRHVAVRMIDTGTPVAEWLGKPASGRAFEIEEWALYGFHEHWITSVRYLRDFEALTSQLG